MRFNDGFIGLTNTKTVYRFSGGDSEDRFNQNLKSQPADWYYRFNELTYDINKLGHRSKNIEDTDLDNYILFTGCSHTEGVGLELEKTFPYLTAKELGVDYYNLALGGTGIDVMTYNLLMWITRVKKLPKALVILWPQTTRFSLLANGTIISIAPASLTNDGPLHNDIRTFIGSGTMINFFETTKIVNTNLINQVYSETKIINLTQLSRVDFARDLAHSGIESNRIMADTTLSYLR
jgi:hypothetical protein